MSLKTLGKGILALSVLSLPNLAHAQFVASHSDMWYKVLIGGNGIQDPQLDEQTGQSEGDFVGTATVPSAYTAFLEGNPLSTADDQIFFRTRHSGDSQSAGYNGYLWVGIDANYTDGLNTIDIFVGVDTQGGPSSHGIVIRNPGTNLNNSPSTTSIDTTNLAPSRYALTTNNFNWSPVSAANFNGTNQANVGAGASYMQVDQFLSFSLPFQDIVTNLNTVGTGRPTPISITKNTPLRYVFMTSQQGNAINQDFNGLNGTTGGYPFDDPNCTTCIQVTIPEPSTLAFLLPGLFFLRRRRK